VCACTCESVLSAFAFFFQAEDGIRDFHVTGVQTCALPIFPVDERRPLATEPEADGRGAPADGEGRPVLEVRDLVKRYPGAEALGSEERRVGKEGRCRRARDPEKKKQEHIRQAEDAQRL